MDKRVHTRYTPVGSSIHRQKDAINQPAKQALKWSKDYDQRLACMMLTRHTFLISDHWSLEEQDVSIEQ